MSLGHRTSMHVLEKPHIGMGNFDDAARIEGKELRKIY